MGWFIYVNINLPPKVDKLAEQILACELFQHYTSRSEAKFVPKYNAAQYNRFIRRSINGQAVYCSLAGHSNPNSLLSDNESR